MVLTERTKKQDAALPCKEEGPAIEAKNVSYSYDDGKSFALRGLNLTIERRRRVAFLGANGAGKSTFFLCLNGIRRITGGELKVCGKAVRTGRRDLLELRSRVGIVFQDPDNQLFSASVAQDISFGAFNMGLPEEEVRRRVEEVIARLGITPFRDKPVHALSGGQKKQVAIADVLVMRPEIIILDEPAAHLDPRHEEVVRRITDDLTDAGITMLIATHDVDYAYAWADEIVVMDEGKVVAQGTPETIFAQKDLLMRTNLQEPAVLQMFRLLQEKGVIPVDAHPPRTSAELARFF